jgi:signal transduction histidine kinase
MKHLYLTLYLALIGILVASLLAAGLMLHYGGGFREDRQALVRGVAELLVENLPPPSSPDYAQALAIRARRLSVDLAVWDQDKHLIGHTTAQPVPFPEHTVHSAFHLQGRPVVMVQTRTGHLAAIFPTAAGQGRFFGGLALFALVAALGCFPLARGITRRLERLQSSMQRWGAGALSVRAPIEGKDEVASVARSFNEAAERLQALVEQRTRILASASHELRSPLTRLRMALSLMPEADADRREELARQGDVDAEELNSLIEDLLLAAKADSRPRQRDQPQLDFGRLVRAEAERAAVACSIEPTRLRGDERPLKRMVRNLIENACKHGDERSTEVHLTTDGTRITLTVEDAGPGVDEAEQQRIFEPFYRPPGHRESTDGGVGLGLSLVRQIAVSHGGRAYYEPRPGGGSRFVVELPASAV